MSNLSSRAPLIAIVGATGTGKSELAVNIAKRYNGEIINGDAMQLYQGLPIITNKIPVAERQDIPHHLLGCIGLDEQTWTVSDFVAKASETIDGIRSRGRLPILVGGTHYYTQSLLFHDNLTSAKQPEETDANDQFPILEAPTEDILAKLRDLDPVMADRWHPKDHRKIRRSLEIWLQTGRKASDIYEEQRVRRGNAVTDADDDSLDQESSLRTRTLVLWVNANTEALPKRLDSRVDKMLSAGLLDEVTLLSQHAETLRASGQDVDTSRGIWVAIGYKEFLDYQSALSNPTTTDTERSRLLAEAVEKTKAATRQYAKRQIRWIRIKLCHALEAAGAKDHFFMLDGSDLSSWHEDVSATGLRLVDAFLKGEQLPDPTSLSPLAAEMLQPKREDMSASAETWKRQYCEACDMTAVTESDWTQHVKSRRHRRSVVTLKRKAEGLSWEQRRKAPNGVGEDGSSAMNDGD